MRIEKQEICRDIAEMAYVIAKADRGLGVTNGIAFQSVKEEFSFDSWAAASRGELLDEAIRPSMNTAYGDLSEDLTYAAVRVMQKVAGACHDFGGKEELILDRSKGDIKNL
jgi:hypothetical protein